MAAGAARRLERTNVALWDLPATAYLGSRSTAWQIYVLTALLSDVQRRRPAWGQESRDGVLNTSPTTAGKTYQHIATLLTRGTADEKDRSVAVTAGPVGADPLRLILCTGRFVLPSTSNESNSKDEEIVASAADEHPIVTRNSSHPDNEIPLVREAPLPTDVSEDVKKMLQVRAGTNVGIGFCLPRLLPGLRKISSLFFVTQCRSKISQRIHALFTGYDIEHLRNWEAVSYEPALQPENLVIDDRLLARALRVPLVPGTTNKFIFDSENAAIWLDTLLNLLVILKEQVDVPIPLPADHDTLMHHLMRLSYLLSKIPTQLWSLKSLSFVVATSRGKASQRAVNLNEDAEDNHNLDDDDLDTLPLRVTFFS
ncbi:hypothetical protein CPB85DRAFT_1555306 [Mucidula mucida]|nr:hypothetical protein CPB85DRAFT_1555306 [Mucidula mucida]